MRHYNILRETQANEGAGSAGRSDLTDQKFIEKSKSTGAKQNSLEEGKRFSAGKPAPDFEDYGVQDRNFI